LTEDNRRRNAADELERAERCLVEARTLHAASLPFGAASRSYYAIFHGARALLVSVGIEPRTDFVRPGRLPAEMRRLLSRM
jgi:uncharacterized protein (UPF0332 family)